MLEHPAEPLLSGHLSHPLLLLETEFWGIDSGKAFQVKPVFILQVKIIKENKPK